MLTITAYLPYLEILTWHVPNLSTCPRFASQGIASTPKHLSHYRLQHRVETLTPEVSVIMPVRQWRPATAAAVASLLTQTMDSFELLLIGQQDVDSLACRLPPDPRIRLIARHQPGIVSALNTGLSAARGRYLARMDDDDIAHPQRLALQLQHLQGPSGTQLCGCRIRFIDSQGNTDTIKGGNRAYALWLNALLSDEQIGAACYIECPMPHPTLMAHRDIWQALGPYRDFDGPEDYDLILRARLMGIRLGKPEPILLDWREHPERLTYNDPRYRREAFARCRARAACDPQSHLGLSAGRPVWLCGTGRHGRDWHDALESSGATVNGFVDRHRHGANRSKRGKPVISYEQLPEQRQDALVIGAVAGPAPRSELLDYFVRQHWREGLDFILGA